MIAASFIFIVVGLGLILAGLPQNQVLPVPDFVCYLSGLALMVVGAVLLALRLYVKTSANRAFVRTGAGGARPILDGGAIVVPIMHNTIPVSLETMKLDVERTGEDALITKDNLRVDVRGEFYIKVDANREDILAAARSLGERGTHPDAVQSLVFEKLVSALRSVAATMDLVDIHSRREDFAKAVFESVREDLKHNGLTLESVTISKLDQTDPRSLSDDNIFDAQGKKKITEITQSALTERTRLERAAEVERNRLNREAERAQQEQNVETRKQILELERSQAEAEATQSTEVANVRAAKQREQQEFQIEQERAVQEAKIAQEQAVRQRQIEQERAVQEAKVLQEQAVKQRTIEQELAVQAAAIDRDKALILREQEKQQADILRKQAIEQARIEQERVVAVSDREKQIAVAQKEALRAQAEREALEAQAAREQADQQILTVIATAEAEREAAVKLTAAKQVIEQDKIKRQTDAEVQAFTQVKQADAEQEAASRRAAAQLQLAEAEAKSKEMVAQGETALKMVEVNVAKEQVNVQRAQVEVERQALENKQTFERAAIEFEKAKLQIEAAKEIQIAIAQALGQFMSRGNFQVYGDPTTMSRMFGQFTQGLGLGAWSEGLMTGTPDSVKEIVSRLGGHLGEALAPLLEKAAATKTGDGMTDSGATIAERAEGSRDEK